MILQKNILWSDECKFTNCGIFKRKNEHVWSIKNPRENRQLRKQVRFSINVWAGIYGDQIIGPFLFEQNLNGNRYLEFLNNLSHIPLTDYAESGSNRTERHPTIQGQSKIF